MAVWLRLMLAVCLVSTSLAGSAHVPHPQPVAAPAAHDHAAPSCHTTETAPAAPTAPDAPCCGTDRCDCGCLPATAVTTLIAPLARVSPPAGPIGNGPGAYTPPALTRPQRPPIG
jgi:hypothetical protein